MALVYGGLVDRIGVGVDMVEALYVVTQGRVLRVLDFPMIELPRLPDWLDPDSDPWAWVAGADV